MRCLSPVGALVVLSLTLATVPTAHAEIWGVKTMGPFSGPPATLFRFEPDGTLVDIVGPVTLNGAQVDLDGMAVDAAGQLFGYVPGDASAQLVRLDSGTAVASTVGDPLVGREIRGAAFDRAGILVALDIVMGELVPVAAGTGLPAGPSVPLTLAGDAFTPSTAADLVVASDGTAMLCSGPIYHVDLTTGALTLFLEDDQPGGDGIALFGAGLALPVDPVDSRLVYYDVNGDDDLFAYELAAPNDRTLLIGNIIPSYNAGRGDLASYPGDMSVGVTPTVPGIELRPARPNPFNPRTTIAFRLPEVGHAKLTVYDLRGRLVLVLHDGMLPAGDHRVAWDGRDRTGAAAASGTYVYRLEAASAVRTRTMTLIQ